MASAINKITGQFISRGIGFQDPNYLSNADWIVNPKQSDIDKYIKKPEEPDSSVLQKEIYIEQKKRELAIVALKADGILDSNGDLT